MLKRMMSLGQGKKKPNPAEGGQGLQHAASLPAQRSAAAGEQTPQFTTQVCIERLFHGYDAQAAFCWT